MVENITFLFHKFDYVKMNHVYRKTNLVVETLANFGHEAEDNRIWFNMIPSRASSVFSFDRIGLDCKRGFSLSSLCFSFVIIKKIM